MVQKFLKKARISGMDPVDSTARSCSRSISLDARSCSPRNRRRRISLLPFSPPFLPISAAARSVAKQKERTDLHTGYATALCSPPRCGGEKTHVCAERRRAGERARRVCVWVWVVPGRRGPKGSRTRRQVPLEGA